LLLEDLDAAFTRSVSRDSASTGVPTTSTSTSTPNNNDTNDGSTLSLSGLLNSLDGVAAAEGRWVFHHRAARVLLTFAPLDLKLAVCHD
jgi:chaperone BCS1